MINLKNNFKKAYSEICGKAKKLCFGRMTPFALIADRFPKGPRTPIKHFVPTLFVAYTGAGLVMSAQSFLNPISFIQDLALVGAAACAAQYTKDRYVTPIQSLFRAARTEGLDRKNAWQHVKTIRKLSNSFNAPLAALHDLGYYTLAQPVPEEHGITFHGKTTKGFRKAYKAALDSVPQTMLNLLKAREVKFHGGTTDSDSFTAILPDADKPYKKHTTGRFFPMPSGNPIITLSEFGYDISEDVLSTDAMNLILDKKLYKVREFNIPEITHHEIGHALDYFLSRGSKRGRFSHRPAFQKALAQDLILRGGEEHIRKLIVQRDNDPDYVLDPQEVFARCYAEIHTGYGIYEDTSSLFPNSYRVTKNIVDGFHAAYSNGPEAVWDFYYQTDLGDHNPTPQNKAQANFCASIQLINDMHYSDWGDAKMIEVWKTKTSKTSLYKHLSLIEDIKKNNRLSDKILDPVLKMVQDAMQEKTPKIPARRPRPPSRFTKKTL